MVSYVKGAYVWQPMLRVHEYDSLYIKGTLLRQLMLKVHKYGNFMFQKSAHRKSYVQMIIANLNHGLCAQRTDPLV